MKKRSQKKDDDPDYVDPEAAEMPTNTVKKPMFFQGQRYQREIKAGDDYRPARVCRFPGCGMTFKRSSVHFKNMHPLENYERDWSALHDMRKLSAAEKEKLVYPAGK